MNGEDDGDAIRNNVKSKAWSKLKSQTENITKIFIDPV